MDHRLCISRVISLGLWISALALLVAIPGEVRASQRVIKEVRIQEQQIADFPSATPLQMSRAVVSRSLDRAALVETEAGKQFVSVSGQARLGPYERVFRGSPVFVGDDSHIALFAQKQGKVFLVDDGVERPLNVMLANNVIGNPRLSPGGKRLVYVEANDKGVRIAEAGKITHRFDRAGYLVFSKNDVIALTGQTGCLWSLWLNKKRMASGYTMISEPKLSEDGKWVFALATIAGGKVLLRNDQVMAKASENVVDFAISPDGSRTAVLRDLTDATGFLSRLEITGLPPREFESVETLTANFSRDSSTVAYAQRNADDSQSVSVNGVDGKAYRAVLDLTLSPTGKGVAYVAAPLGEITQTPAIVVFNGTESSAFASASQLAVSDDGLRAAFVGKLPGSEETPSRYAVVVDNRIVGEFEDVRHVGFTAEGDVYFVTRREAGERIELHVNDAVAALEYDSIPLDVAAIEGPDTLRFLGRRGNKLLRVEASLVHQ